MKKLSIIGIIAFSLSFISCGNIQGNQPDEKPVITQTDTNEAQVEYLTYDSFKEKVWDFDANPNEWKYKGDIPCVIDFYADWCKPCKIVAPIMDKLAKEYDGKVKIYKIDTDKEKKLAGVFGIRSIPTVFFIPKEGSPAKQMGALPESEYKRIIEETVLNNKK